jgi:nickel/cobalt exporter
MLQGSLYLTALSLGVLHALEPGHGKTLMAGALLGASRKWRDPLEVGVSTALGHMLGIVLFVSASFFIAHELAGEEIRRWAEVGAGGLIVAISIYLLIQGINTQHRKSTGLRVQHESAHKPGSSCGCVNHKRGASLSTVGFLIGLVPCPSALAVCLSASYTSSFFDAIFLCFLFALGVAVTLSAIGLAITHSSDRVVHYFAGFRKLAFLLRILSPLAILMVGLLMVGHGLVG